MAPEIVDCQRFRKAVCQHVGTANPFDDKFSIGHQFSDLVVLNVDVLGTGLALSILCQDDARFVVTVKDATARILCEFTEATKKIMSVTETTSKIHEPLTYEEAISDPVHTCK